MEKTIRDLNLTGRIRVFDVGTQSVIYDGSADDLPLRIALQEPLSIRKDTSAKFIAANIQRVYYDTEANWYYLESFLRNQYDDHTAQEKREWYHDSFEEFLTETLKYEPIYEVT